MSLTGQLQAIGSRGYSLQWSQEPSDRPDYTTMVLEVLDRGGAVAFSDRRPIKTSGSVVTKEGEAVQRVAQIAWADEITRHPPTPPEPETVEAAVPEQPTPASEGAPNGEALSPVIPDILNVEADHPI